MNNTYLKIVTATLMLLSLLPETAASDVLSTCVAKKTGALRISKACKKSEYPLPLNSEGIQGSMGPQGPKGEPGNPGKDGVAGAGGGGVRVSDANGQFLGYLAAPPVAMGQNAEISVQIYIPSLKATATIGTRMSFATEFDGITHRADLAEWNAALGWRTIYPYFTTADCTGTEYYFPIFIDYPRVYRKDGGYAIFSDKMPAEKVAIQSHRIKILDQNNQLVDGCEAFNNGGDWMIRGYDSTPVTLPFNIPAIFPLRFE